LFAIFFLYLLVSRMYGRRVGTACLALSPDRHADPAGALFTVDLFVNTFAFLALCLLWRSWNIKKSE
jgi:hypothetical protein